MTGAEVADALLYYSDPDAWTAREQERHASANALVVAEVDAQEEEEEVLVGEDVEAIMSDTPSSGNHGRQSTQRLPKTDDAHDGEIWGAARRGLSTQDHAAVAHVMGGNGTFVSVDWGHFHGLVTDQRPGRPNTLTADELESLDRAAVRTEALAFLGLTSEEMDWLDRPGINNPEKRALLDRLDARCLEVKESTGRTHDLARALGWHIRYHDGKPQCDRMKKALARARKKRAASQG